MLELLLVLFTLSITFIINFYLTKKKILLDKKYSAHKSFTSEKQIPLSGGLVILISLFFFGSYDLFILKLVLVFIFLIGFFSDINYLNSPVKRLILQKKKPKDYVIATGQAYSVREFINIASNFLNMKIYWTGKGLKEVGYIKNGNKKEIIIRIDKNYFRPNEVDYLRGNASEAYKDLNFKPKFTFKDLVKDMIESDLLEAKKEIKLM